jgi:hypothetical protein
MAVIEAISHGRASLKLACKTQDRDDARVIEDRGGARWHQYQADAIVISDGIAIINNGFLQQSGMAMEVSICLQM